MAFFKYVGAQVVTYPTYKITVSPNDVVDFGAGAPPNDGQWQASAGPANNTAVPLNPSSGLPAAVAFADGQIGVWSAAAKQFLPSAGVRPTPSYMPNPTNRFDPVSGLYNVTPSNNRAFTAVLGKAAAGTGVCHDVYISDSVTSGYDGGTLRAPQSWPEFYRQALAVNATPSGGDGLFPCQDTVGTSDARLVLAGGWGSFLGLFPFTSTTGATCTYTVGVGGGRLVLTYDNSAGKPPFTVKIGVAAPVTVTPNGTNTVGIYSPAGTLAAGTVVLVTTGAGTTILFHIGTVGTTGYHKHNLARSSMGATRAADLTYFTNAVTDGAWDPTIATSYSLPAQQAYSALAGAGITAHRVTIALLANDLAGGKTPAQVIAGLQNIITKFPGATVRIVVPWQFATITDAAWEAAAVALYAFVDANGYQLLDWRYALGNYAAMQAAGVLGPDNAHTAPAAWANLGRRTALADLAAG